MRLLNQAVAWMLGGALVALTVAWPLGGAIRALAWPEGVFDADGPDVIAADRIVAAKGGVIWEALLERPYPVPFQGRDCLKTLVGNSLPGGGKDDDVRLWSLLAHRIGEADIALARQISEQALIALPDPVLGALAGCLDGSVLSAACDRWASSRIGNALKAHRAELVSGFIKNADEVQRMACRALDGGTASHNPSARLAADEK